MLVGYARISTQGQTLHLQQDALEQIGCTKIFTETASGAVSERHGLEEALQFVREGDALVVCRLDRLGHSLRHLIEVIHLLQQWQVGFRSITENIDTTTNGSANETSIVTSDWPLAKSPLHSLALKSWIGQPWPMLSFTVNHSNSSPRAEKQQETLGRFLTDILGRRPQNRPRWLIHNHNGLHNLKLGDRNTDIDPSVSSNRIIRLFGMSDQMR